MSKPVIEFDENWNPITEFDWEKLNNSRDIFSVTVNLAYGGDSLWKVVICLKVKVKQEGYHNPQTSHGKHSARFVITGVGGQ